MGQPAHIVFDSALDSEKYIPRRKLYVPNFSTLPFFGLIPDIIPPLSPCSPFPLLAAAVC